MNGTGGGGASDGGRRRDLLVVGASSGGLAALERLLGALAADLKACLLIVLHRLPVGDPTLAKVLDRAGPLPVRDAVDGQALVDGEVLVAPQDHHLLVHGDVVRVMRAPRENRHRPAIDPLFRSAAVSHTSRVVSVLLTGLLNDGTAGMIAVKRCGGLTIVQDPADAEFPDMPRSALRYLEVDRVAPLADLPGVLASLMGTEAPAPPRVPPELAAEVRCTLDGTGSSPSVGELVALACPDCGGPLSHRREDDLSLFRCRVGHAFTGDALLADQEETIERSLWVALRNLEERANMLDSMASDHQRRSSSGSNFGFEDKAAEAREHANRIRRLILSSASGSP